MNRETELQLMREAIAEAKNSKAEDGRQHPQVGAILADAEGKIIYRSHRGEVTRGGHAEFHILSKAVRDGVDLRQMTLFVTLEPCTRRGADKIPCAVRVAESGVKRIVIGTLDPNPQITGRGEMYLSYQMEVDRFPGELVRELQLINQAFFEQHRNTQIPAVSLFAGDASIGPNATFRPALAGQREGILQQSMDLISGTSKDIFIFAGDLSWLRELQLVLLLAHCAKRSVRILCDRACHRPESFWQLTEVARRLGVDVGLYDEHIPVRGTLVSAGMDEAAMMCVERKPSKHALLFRSPHEDGAIKAMFMLAEQLWRTATIRSAHAPEIGRINPLQLGEALKRGIPEYETAKVQVCVAPIDSLKPLTASLERFKLYRLGQVATFRKFFGVDCAAIKGSPWPIIPPIVEELPNGDHVVIDGAHRVYSALEQGISSIEIILFSGASGAFPAAPLTSWDEVVVRTEKLPRDKRYRDFNPHAFRGIRDVVARFVSKVC